MSEDRLLTFDSATKIGPNAVGAVALAASHGGVFAAHASVAAGIVGLVLNDAGVGLEQAGIGGLAYLDAIGIPCATIDYRSARIGDGIDCMTRGIISHANRAAMRLGVEPGMRAREATQRMLVPELTPVSPPRLLRESRLFVHLDGAVRPIWLVDSASQVGPDDQGAVVVTGSHGGLLGGLPNSAIKAPVFAALYNDAGIGVDQAGISRLPALNARGIPAATVDAFSARIGDASSSYETGVISVVNDIAARLGAHSGMSARAFVEIMARLPQKGMAS